MKGLFRLTIVIGTLVGLIFLGWSDPVQGAEKKYKFRFTSAYAATSIDQMVWAKIMKEITERSNGAVTFETYWGSSLGKMAEHLDLIGKRTAELGDASLGAWPARVPIFAFEYAFPFGPSDPLVVTKSMYTIHSEFPEFSKQLKANNTILIANMPWDSYMGPSREQIKSIKDLKGKKMGLWGVYFPKVVEAVGAVGVPRSTTESYMMLKTGVLDISLEPIDVTWTHKHYEVAKHLFLMDSGAFMPKFLIMNLDGYNELTPDLQKLFMEVGRKNALEFAASLKENRAKIIDQMLKEKKMLTTYAPTPTERAQWAAQMADIPAEWAKKMEAQGLPGWKLLDRWMAVTTSMGHTWPRAWGKR